MIRKSMRDNNWLKIQVRQHAGVLAEAKGMMTIIPLRFGTVFNFEAGIQRFVESQRTNMLETLARLQDKSEFGIRVVCDLDLLGHAQMNGDHSVRTSLDQMSNGVADMIRGQMNDSNLNSTEMLIANFTARIHGGLNEIAAEAVSKDLNSVPAPDGSVVLMNATYLVPVVGEKNFKARITSLAREMQSAGVTIEVSGPWPPYHFVDVDMDDTQEFYISEIPV
jgi:hypothetical protein